MQSISIKLLSVLTHMVANSLIPATQSCGDGHGLELWRSFAARWQGQSKQVVAATLCSYITPARCSSTMQLWEALPAWEQKAAQLSLANEPISELMRAQALNALVPTPLLNDIISRLDLEAYDAKLRYVKQHMEHARGAAQSRGAALNSCAIGSEEEWPEADWYDPAALGQQVVYALTKGKGKGCKGGGNSIGKGTNRDGSAFAGECFIAEK